jgi:hypothetical protein
MTLRGPQIETLSFTSRDFKESQAVIDKNLGALHNDRICTLRIPHDLMAKLEVVRKEQFDGELLSDMIRTILWYFCEAEELVTKIDNGHFSELEAIIHAIEEGKKQ